MTTDPKLGLFNFRPPKQTRKQRVLEKHGYEEKVFIENGEVTRFIVPVYDNPYDAIANRNEGVSGPAHYCGSIVFQPGESVKQFFLRLGWIDENGNIL